MDNYKVTVTPQALKDLEEVYTVTLELSADRDIAYTFIETIKSSIRRLKSFPDRGTIRTVGRHKGYRQIFVKKYTVVYRVDYENKKVYIVAVKPKKNKL